MATSTKRSKTFVLMAQNLPRIKIVIYNLRYSGKV